MLKVTTAVAFWLLPSLPEDLVIESKLKEKFSWQDSNPQPICFEAYALAPVLQLVSYFLGAWLLSENQTQAALWYDCAYIVSLLHRVITISIFKGKWVILIELFCLFVSFKVLEAEHLLVSLCQLCALYTCMSISSCHPKTNKLLDTFPSSSRNLPTKNEHFFPWYFWSEQASVHWARHLLKQMEVKRLYFN